MPPLPPLPAEWVLRELRDLDISSEDAVAALARQYVIRDPGSQLRGTDSQLLQTLRFLASVWEQAATGQKVAPRTWERFAEAVLAGVGAVRLQVRYHPDKTADTVSPAPVDLYTAACIQIHNFIARGEHARACANETCGRTFIHQQGGARQQQYRTDAKYCTPHCARAQANREWRRRKQAGKAETKPKRRPR
ncbi:MAG: hypothetical protein J2O48_02600 [Solirubrobacterales bacterium]|nr:hypothetical protein [Solirubrobacterales bacterium]